MMVKKICTKVVAVALAAAALAAVAATSANAHQYKKVRPAYGSAPTVLVPTGALQQPSIQPWCDGNYRGPFQCGGL